MAEEANILNVAVASNLSSHPFLPSRKSFYRVFPKNKQLLGGGKKTKWASRKKGRESWVLVADVANMFDDVRAIAEKLLCKGWFGDKNYGGNAIEYRVQASRDGGET